MRDSVVVRVWVEGEAKRRVSLDEERFEGALFGCPSWVARSSFEFRYRREGCQACEDCLKISINLQKILLLRSLCQTPRCIVMRSQSRHESHQRPSNTVQTLPLVTLHQCHEILCSRIQAYTEQVVMGRHGTSPTGRGTEAILAGFTALDGQLDGCRGDGEETLSAELAASDLVESLGWWSRDVGFLCEEELSFGKGTGRDETFASNRVKVNTLDTGRVRDAAVDVGFGDASVCFRLFLLL